MRDTGGAFVAIGSIACDIPSPILSAYSASKHAVKGFVEALRMEFFADAVPISVTLVKPSGIDTPVAQHAANHVDGEARIPPLVYDPALVAEAILDAAQHPRREVTVGGAGRVQVLFGTHFPRLLERMAGPLAAMMSDPARPRTTAHSMFAPNQPGRARSGVQAGRRTSLYTVTQRHPVATRTAMLAVAATLVAVVRRRAR
jgi:NAD(P)-dependent dehydrogenase (short-subunit alcohol dehydrogenase family)